MSSLTNNKKDEDDEVPPPQRPPSPPPHTTFAARGIHPPTFSAFKPRDIRISSPQGMSHIAWNCDGKRLAAVGIDKVVRVWWPDKSMELRSASMFSGGHSDDVDYLSWNPTHPDLFCTSSQRDRRIVFWDARQSRYVQQVNTRGSPVKTDYAPDGRIIVYTEADKRLNSLKLEKVGGDVKEQWHIVDRPPLTQEAKMPVVTFNHAGDGLIVTPPAEHTLRAVAYPSLNLVYATPAHVGGCVASALDPRGRYLASGGYDTIVNLFDLSDWICARTITTCDHSITAINFSHDGEFLAIASQGSYIDICAVETGQPMHRVPTLGPSAAVQWHPSRYIIAYCGQTKIREGGPPPAAWISLFGPGM